MDSKAPASSLYLFKETRVDLDPDHPCSVIQIQVPSTSTFSIRPRQQRRILRASPTYKDEDTFNKHCIASSSSFYFGKSKKHPRSFIWRVLQEGKLLELCSADLSKKNREEREASFILQLWLPTAIKHGGVALADAEDQDALSVFALTKGNEVYTFTLRKDFFCHAAASEEDISRWCKASKPATFSISAPHSLISASTLQLIVSLTDGRLLQLRRKKEEDGSRWHESTYGDGQWASSLRGLVRWQGSNTVKYDGSTLEQGTPIAMALSPDKKHVFAVCLNHTLRIWNPKKATSVFSKDLLWQHRESHDIPKLMLDPGNPNALQVFETEDSIEGDLYYAVTFSPHDFGQFKFWGIRDPDHGERGVRDLFPEHSLQPPDPDPSPESKAIWKVAEFKIKSGQRGQQSEMWVLMRSNRRHKLYNLKFEIEDLPDLWQDNWSTTALETSLDPSAPLMSHADPEDATDKWLDFILSPNKYPDVVLETALAMYCSKRSVSLPNTKASLKERICAAITSRVNDVSPENDFDKYGKAMDQEWTVLWQDIRDLDRSRWEVLSLAYDDHAQMPYITFADGVSAIRTCDKVELIAQNSSTILGESVGMLERPSIEVDQGKEPKLPDEIAVIIEAATMFRQDFSYDLLLSCKSVLAEELWLEPSCSTPIRIQSFYDRCNFAQEISTHQIKKLAEALQPIGGYDGLDTETFLALLDEMFHRLPPDSGLAHTTFGQKMLVSGAREMIKLRERLLFDLVVYVVFVDMETNREDWPMLNFDANITYEALLDLLKQYQIMQWLASNVRVDQAANAPKSTIDAPNNDPTQTSTVLENLFALDIAAQTYDVQSQSEALTHTIQDLLQHVVGGNDGIPLDKVQVYIQCNLLANNNIDLASEFLRYQPSTEWASYIKGRLHLLKGEFTEAAIYFKKAAFKLCESTQVTTKTTELTTESPPFRFPLRWRIPRSPLPYGRSLLWQRPPNLLHPHPKSLRLRLLPLANGSLRAPCPPIEPPVRKALRTKPHAPNIPFPSLPSNNRLHNRLLSPNAASVAVYPPPKLHLFLTH